jgi:aprataxin
MSSSKSSPEPKKSKSVPSKGSAKTNDVRTGLAVYLDDPTNPRVLSYNDDFVIIRDMYPKATIHLLILPRDREKQLQLPNIAFDDAAFLSKVKAEGLKWSSLAAKELARTICPPNLPPPNRDWEAEIKVGIHSVPSMNHLHIHIISRDMHSPCLRHRKHYNSFNTPFFVSLDDFPMTAEEMEVRIADALKGDMICWRCGKNFENKFTALKQHLEGEFKEWKEALSKVVNE